MKVQLLPLPTARASAKAIESAIVQGARDAGLDAQQVVTPSHKPGVVLVMYGSGSPERTGLMNHHIASGGRVVCMDGGYFGRKLPANGDYFRFAVDALHVKPQHMESTADDDSRVRQFGLSLRDEYRADGPVIVVGMGRKSRAGLGLMDWEERALASAKARFPGHKVIYRPKLKKHAPKDNDPVRWQPRDGASPINQLINGASLVIARHSNVTIEACIAGIPVECEEGAAAWLYKDGATQSPERRASFLRRLAWWQWKPSEAIQAWKFLLKVLG